MKKYKLLFLLMLSGCLRYPATMDANDIVVVKDTASELWETHIGDIYPECYEYMYRLKVMMVDNITACGKMTEQKAWEQGRFIAGCIKYGEEEILITDDDRYNQMCYLFHEYLHALNLCVYGYYNHDYGHTALLLWEMNVGKESLEYVGCMELRTK